MMTTLERTKKARERQLEVKKRREEQTIATENFRLIWLQKQSLLRHIRAEMVSKKLEELRVEKIGRTWYKHMIVYQVLQKYF